MEREDLRARRTDRRAGGRARWARPAGLACGLALLGTQAACITYATGRAHEVEPPAELGTAPPRLYVDTDHLREVVHAELARTGAFGEPAESAEEADVVLRVHPEHGAESGIGLLLGAATLWTLPTPFERLDRRFRASLVTPPLEPFELPTVERRIHAWAGIPLLLLWFWQVDRPALHARMGEELARLAHRGYAEHHASAWRATEGSEGPDRYEAFLAAFPGSVHAERASAAFEEELWELVRASDETALHLRYLEAFPDGPHAGRVRERGSDLLWDELERSREVETLETFLAAFPGDPRADHARGMLEEVTWARATAAATDAELYRAYVERFPDGRFADEARDAVAWADAERAGTPEAVRSYLEERPEGTYADRARVALDALTDPVAEEVADTIATAVDRALETLRPGLGTRGRWEGKGLLTTYDGVTSVILRYRVVYEGTTLVEREILSGAVHHGVREYRCGEDGRWYPAFERLFDPAGGRPEAPIPP